MTAESLQNYYLMFYNEVCTNFYALCLCKPPYFINYQINCTYSVEHNTGSLKIKLCLCLYATCFGPFSGHHQACKCKNITKEDVTR